MVMTDPIADMLTRIRNANSVHHDKVEIPGSKRKSNFRPQTYFQAWPARIFPERSAAEGSRRPGYRNHLHLSGADDR